MLVQCAVGSESSTTYGSNPRWISTMRRTATHLPTNSLTRVSAIHEHDRRVWPMADQLRPCIVTRKQILGQQTTLTISVKISHLRRRIESIDFLASYHLLIPGALRR